MHEEQLNPTLHSEEIIGEAETFKNQLLRLKRENKLAVFSAFVIFLFILAAVFAPLLTPYGYADEDIMNRLQPPSSEHWLGTDDAGRDVFTRLLYGARISLAVGIIPTMISILFGAMVGIIAGFVGGKVDAVIMRIADVMLAFPSMLLAMVIMYTLGDGIINIFLALALVNWASVARVVRSETLALKKSEYVEAARCIGVKQRVIMMRHILPNCLPSMIVLFTLNIPSSILAESSLSFLGVGIQLPQAAWGLMVNTGRQFFYSHPWLSLAPSIAIMIIVMAFNFLGDGLRDVMDPHLKK
ncbi:MAG: ABC transporter permease [Firmicutes bacterium]|nr:ABC transporter permease [Bacillota bacterium]MBQ3112365.1 ABC transporter permease [Bacillota bacterium]MBQ6842329.1 ABC transporter permease [Bacillota bacterium]MBR6823514.1 ABC transporter permease [Bacillota bacterium]MBR7114098.1 ABC transporter permease [Bacillota bacterium]